MYMYIYMAECFVFLLSEWVMNKLIPEIICVLLYYWFKFIQSETSGIDAVLQ